MRTSHPKNTLGFEFLSQVGVIWARSDVLHMTVFKQCVINEGNSQFIFNFIVNK